MENLRQTAKKLGLDPDTIDSRDLSRAIAMAQSAIARRDKGLGIAVTRKGYQGRGQDRGVRAIAPKIVSNLGTPINGNILKSSVSSNPDVVAAPSYWNVLKRLRIDVRTDHAVNRLQNICNLCRIEYTVPYGGTIPVTEILKALGVSSAYDFSEENVGDLLAPKHWIAKALSMETFDRRKRQEILAYMLGCTSWASTPNLVRIGVDIFRLSPNSTRPVESVKTLARHRITENKDRRKSVFSKKSKWKEPTYENAPIGISEDYPRFSFQNVMIAFIPSGNRGKHVCSVRVIDKANHNIYDVGTIRNHKGKLHFFSGVFSDDPAKVRRIAKQYSVSHHKTEKAIAGIKAEIARIGSEITRLKSDDRKSGLPKMAIAHQINDLEKDRERLKSNLSDLTGQSLRLTDQVNEAIGNFPAHLIAGTFEGFKRLGIHPNQMVKSLPYTSPLASPKFWAQNFGVLVIQDAHTHPVRFHKDLRKGK